MFCLQVMFAMQGEMSATVVRHPRSWTSLVSRLKNDIVTLRDDADLLMPNLKVGGEQCSSLCFPAQK
jgi:hypothetical protein